MSECSALDVANYFIELATAVDENDLTNLKLQKLLYFAQGHHLAINKKRLFVDQVEAWDLGPVVRSVYDVFKEYSCYPITVFDVKTEVNPLSKEQKLFIDKVWDKYGKWSAGYLVSLTHKPHSPWSKVFVRGFSNVISDDLMESAFEKKAL